MEMLFAAYGAGFLAVFALVVYEICSKIATVSRAQGMGKRFASLVCAGMVGWSVLALALSLNGFFHSSMEYSQDDLAGLAVLLAMMIVPLALFALLYRTTDSLKRVIDRIEIQALIRIQAFRLCGSYFLFLAWANRAPAIFALPAGILDLLVGVFALIIPRLFAKQVRSAGTLAAVWSYAGLIDFAAAFTIYFLYFPFRILEAPASQILIGGFFPIAFIVMFPVPLAIILHMLTLMKLQKSRQIATA